MSENRKNHILKGLDIPISITLKEYFDLYSSISDEDKERVIARHGDLASKISRSELNENGGLEEDSKDAHYRGFWEGLFGGNYRVKLMFRNKDFVKGEEDSYSVRNILESYWPEIELSDVSKILNLTPGLSNFFNIAKFYIGERNEPLILEDFRNYPGKPFLKQAFDIGKMHVPKKLHEEFKKSLEKLYGLDNFNL